MLLVVAVALIDAQGRVLLARRPEGKKMAGMWEFPGGKVEPGETPEAALVRELREELGIETTPNDFAPFVFASHPYESFHLLMPVFLCRRWAGEPRRGGPGTGLGGAGAPGGVPDAAGRPAVDPHAERFFMTQNPTAAILIIGNEILSGRTQDVNVQFIAKRLADLGIKLEEVRVVPDIPGRIIGAVNELRASYDLLFTTGGIGPTHDDITSECIAAAFGVPWELHEETVAMMRERLGEELNAARLRMATMPRGAVPINNEISIAPGFSIGNVHVMAGVPRIMQSMFLALEPQLPRGERIEMRAVYGMGVLEGSIAAGLAEIQDRFPRWIWAATRSSARTDGGWRSSPRARTSRRSTRRSRRRRI